MNNSFATDTMALVLRLEKRKLNPKVKNIFQEAEKGNAKIFIPAMVLAEIGYLSEKKRIESNLKIAKNFSGITVNQNLAAFQRIVQPGKRLNSMFKAGSLVLSCKSTSRCVCRNTFYSYSIY